MLACLLVQTPPSKEELARREREEEFVSQACLQARELTFKRLQSEAGKVELKAEARKQKKLRKAREKAYLEIADEGERERVKLRDTFDAYDLNGSGDIDRHEFKLMLRDLCMPLEGDELRAAFDAIDGDGSGEIDFEEFEAWHSGAAASMSEAMRRAAEEMREQKAQKDKRGKTDLMHARRASGRCAFSGGYLAASFGIAWLRE